MRTKRQLSLTSRVFIKTTRVRHYLSTIKDSRNRREFTATARRLIFAQLSTPRGHVRCSGSDSCSVYLVAGPVCRCGSWPRHERDRPGGRSRHSLRVSSSFRYQQYFGQVPRSVDGNLEERPPAVLGYRTCLSRRTRDRNIPGCWWSMLRCTQSLALSLTFCLCLSFFSRPEDNQLLCGWLRL